MKINASAFALHFALKLEDCFHDINCIHLHYLILVEITHHQNQLLFVIFLRLYDAVGSF